MLQSEGNPNISPISDFWRGSEKKEFVKAIYKKQKDEGKRFTDCSDRKTEYQQGLEDKNVLL